MADFSQEISGHTLEFFEDEHLYLVDGIIVPSITQILAYKFGGKYAHVRKDVLERAAQAGTAVHEAIERYCTTGEECELPELRNFKFLQRQYGFVVRKNEVPVILFDVCEGSTSWTDNPPIAAGRLDLVLQMGIEFGGADIKRTSTLDKEYLAYQLNLYRVAYRQCYGIEWDFLRGIHLREDVRKFVQIPINEGMAWQLVNDYLEANHAEH